MAAAAFFDLDRTLLPQASGTIFGRYLEAEGLEIGAAKLPGADLLVSIYDLFGETRLNMQLAQLGVRAAKGWSVEAVERAARAAVPDLIAAMGGYAQIVLDEHRRAGDKLVLASTSPVVLIQPMADALGFDAVIGTVWSHDDGVFTGETDGPFVWGTKKREAVSVWARRHEIDLGECSAYSDSYFDTPMLEAVGRAVAVNPDARLAVVAALHGWEIRNLDAPTGVLKVLGRELQQWAQPFRRPELAPMAQWDISGVGHVPQDGPAIVAFNHRSYFDTMAMSLLFAKVGRPARFLGKAEMFDNPILGPFVRNIGGIRVDRGSGSSEPLRKAFDALHAGEIVAIAPQGTIPRGRDFFDPVLVGRPGVATLAKETKAPVIPVGLWGTERVWPRNQKVPTIVTANRPLVQVVAGPPVDVKRRSIEADTKRVMTAISNLLPDDSRQVIEPTREQLAKTFPPGHVGDNDSRSGSL